MLSIRTLIGKGLTFAVNPMDRKDVIQAAHGASPNQQSFIFEGNS
jgi:hypothetical protein